MTRRARGLGLLVLGVVWLHQVAIAVLSPLSERDWAMTTDGPIGPTLGAAWHWLIVRSQIAHVALTPLVITALPLGLAVLVRDGTTDGDRDRDGTGRVLRLAVIAAGLWLAVPLFGLACSFRYAAATFLVPLTAAIWYLVALRRAVAGGRAPVAVIALAGIVAGASTLPIALATLAVAVVIARRGPRRLAACAVAGVAIGAGLAIATEWPAIVLHTQLFEPDLAARAFTSQLRVCGWLGAATAAGWLGHTAVATIRGRALTGLPVPALDAIARALALGLAIAMLGLATTDFGSFQCIATGAAVAAVAATVATGLATGRRARIALVVIVVAVQAKMTSASLRTLASAHAEYAARIAALAAAPPGSIATVPPYKHRSKEFFFGEDFRTSARRDRVATLRFGLRGIQLAPERRDVQSVPALALYDRGGGLEGAASPAGFPAFYSADLTTARDQFAAAVHAGHATDARLLVDAIAVPDHPGVPVMAAWLGRDGEPAWWHLLQRRVDREGQIRLVPAGPGLAGDDASPELTAMWMIDLASHSARPLARGDDGAFRLRPGQRLNAALVACTADRCVLCDVVGLF